MTLFFSNNIFVLTKYFCIRVYAHNDYHFDNTIQAFPSLCTPIISILLVYSRCILFSSEVSPIIYGLAEFSSVLRSSAMLPHGSALPGHSDDVLSRSCRLMADIIIILL